MKCVLCDETKNVKKVEFIVRGSVRRLCDVCLSRVGGDETALTLEQKKDRLIAKMRRHQKGPNDTVGYQKDVDYRKAVKKCKTFEALEAL